VEGIPTETRMKILRLIENMTGGTCMVESMHGAGPPKARRDWTGGVGNLPQKIKWAKTLAKIKDE
jgi:4-hydroxybutyryl-CoA dehydratase/vinylacetyl-CoA-Delta-isomerase